VKKELEEHIKAEEKMMRQIEEELKKTDDEALKLLLEHFAEDEKKHHANLKTILNKAYKIEI
jgi:rubrerythrin